MGSGASLSKFNVELYTWSSSSTAQFPEEHALIYRYGRGTAKLLLEPEKCCIFHWRVNPHTVTCSLLDYIRKSPRSPVRIHTEFTAERGTNGARSFSRVRVAARGTDHSSYDEKRDKVVFLYDGIGTYVVQRRDQSWEVKHEYSCGSGERLRFCMSVVCDRGKGLCMEFNGPLQYNGVFSEKVVGLWINREVQGEPSGEYIEEVKREFEGEEFSLLEAKKEKGRTRASSASSITGLLNNIDTHIEGKGNASVYYNCRFYEPHNDST